MKGPPLPPGERARLEAVRRTGLLDTPPEQAFDDFTRLASLVCDAPTALITILDEERQWFKSRLNWGSTESPREISFCGHAILDERVMEVPDALLDERFHDNPLVTAGPRIRFYAGVPLRMPDGQAIGTLCTIDQKPRQLSERQLEALRALGRQLVSLVLLRQTAADLARAHDLLDRDLQAAARLQRMLVPRQSLQVAGIQAAWRFRPSATIGGDIFNLVRLGPDELALYVVDVSGHGVPSALVTFAVAQALVVQAPLPSAAPAVPAGLWSPSPARVLERLDREFPFERFERFLTMACLVLDTRTGTLRHSSAAHPPPVLQRADGALQLLESGGGVLGCVADATFEEGTVALAPGDRVVLFTDGLLEATDPQGREFGQERFLEALRRGRSLELEGACDEVVAAVDAFRQGEPLEDDASLLLVEFRGRP